MENDIFALKRDYKHALENLTKVKKETAEIITTKEKVTKDFEDKQIELTEVINQISQEKLDWATHRHQELEEIEKKNSEAGNIIKRKGELNLQEETIRQIEAKNTEILNEIRRLELKVQEEKTDLASKEKEIEDSKKAVRAQQEETQKATKEFKSSIINLIKTVENL